MQVLQNSRHDCILRRTCQRNVKLAIEQQHLLDVTHFGPCVGAIENVSEDGHINMVGTLGGKPISDGRLRGDELTFTAGGQQYTAKVSGNQIQGARFTATKKQ